MAAGSQSAIDCDLARSDCRSTERESWAGQRYYCRGHIDIDDFYILDSGSGTASNFSTSVNIPPPHLRESSTRLMTQSLVLHPNKRFAILPLVTYQLRQDENFGRWVDRWLSLGRSRPFFTRHSSFALEDDQFSPEKAALYKTLSRRPVDPWRAEQL